MTLSDGERARLEKLTQKGREIREFICARTPTDVDVRTWFAYLSAVKALQGNADNDLSFLACILAKNYLLEQHGPHAFDAAQKAQGAPGLDVDFRLSDGTRVVGEIKTTTPYLLTDFGAQQRTSMKKDLAKLQAADAGRKYFFVTDERTYDVLNKKHAHDLVGIELVLLEWK